VERTTEIPGDEHCKHVWSGAVLAQKKKTTERQNGAALVGIFAWSRKVVFFRTRAVLSAERPEVSKKDKSVANKSIQTWTDLNGGKRKKSLQSRLPGNWMTAAGQSTTTKEMK
jgi:hypothetical protein